MKTKLFVALTLGIFLAASFAYAFTLTATPSSLNFFEEGDSRVVTISSSDNFSISPVDEISPITSGDAVARFSAVAITPISGVTSVDFNVTLDSITSSFPIGQFSTTFTVEATNSSGNTTQINVPVNYVTSFCLNGPQNETDLDLLVDISNNGRGDEDDEWITLDTIEVEVELQNDGAEDWEDVIFRLGLFEEGTSSNVADDLIWISSEDEEFEFGDIDEGDDGVHTFEFRVDPELDEGDYLLIVKAFPDGEEREMCIDYSEDFDSEFFEEIRIDKEDDERDMVVIDDSELQDQPIVAQCGEQVSLLANVHNIGDEDFDDRIGVSLMNAELDIDLFEEVLGDFDEGDSTSAAFNFMVPRDAEEKTYLLSMRTFYDFRESDGRYRTTSSDSFTAFLQVSGNCEEIGPELSISSSFVSQPRPGQELTMDVVFTNTGTESVTYDLTFRGYEGWAILTSTPQTSITLDEGQSEVIRFTFDVDSDAQGTQSLFIDARSNGMLETQEIQVNVRDSNGVDFDFNLPGNIWIWVIAAINILLIIVIIIVAVRVSRR